jgi:DNA-binding NarL/FixJ family response regulator
VRPVSILIVDDHGIVRDGLRSLLRCEHDLKVVGLAATGENAVLAAQRLKPDVIIMDLLLPMLNGIDATRRILDSLPKTRIIVLSACDTSEHVYRALRAGALGYVIKDAAASEVVRAVRTVSAGKKYLSPALAAVVSGDCLKGSVARTPLERLSARERDVLNRTVEGYSSRQIGLQLSLSPKTVDTYRSRLMEKLGLSDRTALFRFAFQNALAPG